MTCPHCGYKTDIKMKEGFKHNGEESERMGQLSIHKEELQEKNEYRIITIFQTKKQTQEKRLEEISWPGEVEEKENSLKRLQKL